MIAIYRHKGLGYACSFWILVQTQRGRGASERQRWGRESGGSSFPQTGNHMGQHWKGVEVRERTALPKVWGEGRERKCGRKGSTGLPPGTATFRNDITESSRNMPQRNVKLARTDNSKEVRIPIAPRSPTISPMWSAFGLGNDQPSTAKRVSYESARAQF